MGTVLYNLAGKNRKKMKGIIGKKIGMTSIFDPSGKQTACTIIEAGPCIVTQVKTQETDGYNALQIAFGDKKEKHTLDQRRITSQRPILRPRNVSKNSETISRKKILVMPLR